MEQKSVVVYILPVIHNSTPLQNLFIDEIVTVINTVNIIPTTDRSSIKGLTKKQCEEWEQVFWILNDAAVKYPHAYPLIIRDTSITVADSVAVGERLRDLLAVPNWDLAYLARWLDRCELHSEHIDTNDSNARIVRTFAPNGVQALLLSPAGRDKLLGRTSLPRGKKFKPIYASLSDQLRDYISMGLLRAITLDPPLFAFNPLYAQDSEDYLKTHDCAVPHYHKDGSNEYETKSKGKLLLWALIIILLVIVITWIIARMIW